MLKNTDNEQNYIHQYRRGDIRPRQHHRRGIRGNGMLISDTLIAECELTETDSEIIV